MPGPGLPDCCIPSDRCSPVFRGKDSPRHVIPIKGSEHLACAPGSTELCFQSAPDLLQRMLPHFQAQARRVRDPNHREMFNTLLARAQAA